MTLEALGFGMRDYAAVVAGGVAYFALGALIGVGVAAMEGMKGAVYSFDDRARPWPLYAINAGYAVCGLVLAGAVYALIA